MKPYPIPADDAGRVREVDRYAPMDTSPAEEFDHIVQMAARIFCVKTVLISLVHQDRQYFKARVNFDRCDTGRDVSFCAFTIMDGDVLVVPDAWVDPRFQCNELVTGGPRIRFYAGAPLISPSGFALGSLCLIDVAPRYDFGDRERQILTDLAVMVLERLELRRLERENNDSRSRFRNVASSSPDAIICADAHNRITSWNSAAEKIFGYSGAEVVGQSLDLIVPTDMRRRHNEGLARVAAGGETHIIGSSVNLTARHRDGTEFPIELSLSQWMENGVRHFGAIIRDITRRAQAEAKLKRAAELDHLTGLANRETLKQAMHRSCRDDLPAAVLLIDLDGFKDVNDTLGHSAGDFVLKVIAERLRSHVATEHMVGRLGGDEFVVLLDTVDPIAASSLGSSLISVIEEEIEYEDQSLHLGASVGIALRSGPECGEEELLSNADLALYQAKADGRHLIRMFSPDLRQTMRKRSAVSSSMRQAWERGEFELYYQPQVDLTDGLIKGAEALIRWNHPTMGVVSPAAFLPVLESGLLAVPVGEWILRTACRQAAEWRRAGLSKFRIGVNLFAAQFRTRDFAQTVETTLAEFELPPQALELEITENIILQNEQRIMEPLRYLRDLGVGIAFDDFGTGFASLSLLKHYPVTRLKIDRSFVSGDDRTEKDNAIVESVTRLAAAFDLEVIAEGIETPEQEALMQAFHCDEGQGYLYGRPMTAAQFAARWVSPPARDDRQRSSR